MDIPVVVGKPLCLVSVTENGHGMGRIDGMHTPAVLNGDPWKGADVGIQVQKIQSDDGILIEIAVGMGGNAEQAAFGGDICNQRIQQTLTAPLHFSDVPQGSMDGDRPVPGYAKGFQLCENVLFCIHDKVFFPFSLISVYIHYNKWRRMCQAAKSAAGFWRWHGLS